MVRGRDDAQLERLMSFPAMQWMIFKGMERVLQGRANGFRGTVEYQLRGAGREARWHLRVEGSDIEARPGAAQDPVLVFRTTLPVFARMAARELNPAHAILERKLEVQGDIKALAKFSAMFEM
jgi:putative sterol carrier protein